MSIEIGQKYISKDGEVVNVIQIEEFNYDKRGALVTLSGIVIFSPVKNENIGHVLTERDFLEQYKPYEPEPVFEWQWAYITNSLLRWHISNYMTEEEFKKWKYGANSSLEYKRLDFTKRERK